ncbi:hypothetical protein QJS10_CPA01g02291 [Acorus calamus]|uniref:Reverse transcriptase domain-containing protein n=1 Tax=Acorus calamus TaxID=4465 RepID=A0AAV9FG12_ACOCL|nr:hypothetical protein QJS10_CPA01g02291 [Acorus calamus]
MACIQSPQFSVLINGSPFGFFESSSGLRQGDPISPLLFVLGEILSQSLGAELKQGKIGSFTKHSSAINHLLFTDDLIIFTPINRNSGNALRTLLSNFAAISGLELNYGKSSVFCGGRDDLHMQFSIDIRIPQGSLPVTHLAFVLPQGTIKAMEKTIRSFLWGGPSLKRYLHHVNWKTVCLPKAEGGLGLKKIGDWSKAALGARFWEIAMGGQSI